MAMNTPARAASIPTFAGRGKRARMELPEDILRSSPPRLQHGGTNNAGKYQMSAALRHGVHQDRSYEYGEGDGRGQESDLLLDSTRKRKRPESKISPPALLSQLPPPPLPPPPPEAVAPVCQPIPAITSTSPAPLPITPTRPTSPIPAATTPPPTGSTSPSASSSTPTPAEFVGRSTWNKLDTPLHNAIARITKRYQKRIQRALTKSPSLSPSLIKSENYAQRNAEIAEHLRHYGITVDTSAPTRSPSPPPSPPPPPTPPPPPLSSVQEPRLEALQTTLQEAKTAAQTARNAVTTLRYTRSHSSAAAGVVDVQIAQIENFIVTAERFGEVIQREIEGFLQVMTGDEVAMYS